MGFLFCLFLFGVFVCLGFWFVLGLFVFLFVWFCFSFVDTLQDEWAEEYESVGALLSVRLLAQCVQAHEQGSPLMLAGHIFC